MQKLEHYTGHPTYKLAQLIISVGPASVKNALGTKCLGYNHAR